MRPIVLEVEQLQNNLLGMAGLVEAAIHNSGRSLLLGDRSLANETFESERRINELQIEIDELATRLLARQQPVAKDLRFVTAAIKINSDLERMGDLAVNIAEHSVALLDRPLEKGLLDLPRMFTIVESMVRNSLDAMVRRDESLAYEVLRSDDLVDDMKDAAYRELLELMESRPAGAAPAFDLIFIAHNLERIADHATNIAEDVLFIIKGMDVRHRRPE